MTSDRPPLSIGLSDASLNEWEDLCDLDGNPTGVEVMELNIRPPQNDRGLNNTSRRQYADDINDMNDGFDHMLVMVGRDVRMCSVSRWQVMCWGASIILEMVIAWFLNCMAERERLHISSELEAIVYIDQLGQRGESGVEQGGGTCSAELGGTKTSSEDSWEKNIDVVNDDRDGQGSAEAQSDDESGYLADIDSGSDME